MYDYLLFSLHPLRNAALAKYKQQLQDANIVIQRPKSTKLRWKKREAARSEK